MLLVFCFFKQKTAYEMRISDWSSDVCSSDLDFGTDAQKRRFLPTIADGGLGALAITEPTAGSDATGMRTRFTPEGDEIVIDGGKIFITDGDVADIYFLFGKWSELGDGKAALSVVMLEKDTHGLKVLRKEDRKSPRGSSTAAIAFEGCRVQIGRGHV